MWDLVQTPILRLLPIVIVFVVLTYGAVVFRKKSKFFAEEV